MSQQFIEKALLLYPLYMVVIYFIWTFRNFKMENKDSRVDVILNNEEKYDERIKDLEKKIEQKLATKDVRPIAKSVKNAHNKIEVLDKKVDDNKIEAKQDVTKLEMTLPERIKYEIEQSIQLRSYLTQEEKAHLDMKILEENRRINIDNGHIDLQMKRIVNDVIDIYFKNNYLARREAYDISTGMFNLPMITDQTKADDIKEIYEQVMILLDAEYVKANFDAVYDLSRPETKLFLIEKYIVPPYADKLEQMITDWQSIQRAMEEDGMEKEKELQIKKAQELKEKERAESNLGQFESSVNSIYDILLNKENNKQ